ncbi:MAG: class I SAM-dependent methyltransferase [Polyangiales bacterium]
MDPFAQFKAVQKVMWSGFAAVEMFTGRAAPHLVRFAGVQRGMKVLDVACGTGVVALTAARMGATVTGIDLTPELVAHAKENAALAKAEIEIREGDVESLPFEGGTFDRVVSQFGHMFAPRPEVAVAEMLRVLKPGGTIAFSTWPPELFTGRFFALVNKYSPMPPPAGVAPPPLWGDPNVVRERLGDKVKDLVFDRAMMTTPMLSPQHGRAFMERTIGPLSKVVAALEADPPKLASLRREMEELMTIYFEDNAMRQDFLMTRAVKA